MGFDFDKEYQALCVATPKLQRGTDWPRKTASALVTKAIDAFLADLGARAAFRYRDEHQGLEYAMATARTLIPKPPPPPPDPMAEYVKRLEEACRATGRVHGNGTHGRACMCVGCECLDVLASKPKEAKP